MQVRTLIGAVACLLLIVSFALSACSSDSDDSNDGGDVPTDTASPDDQGTPVGPALLDQPDPAQAIVANESEPAAGIVDVTIAGALFENNNIVMSLGEPVAIRVTNNDPQTHNLRIAGLDGEFNTEDDAATDPQAIAAGETGELTFAPPVAGSYTFRCDFHPATMGGVITVQ